MEVQPLFSSTEYLEEGWSKIHSSPKEEGTLEMIVTRPDVNERVIIEQGMLDEEKGLIGDSWEKRPGSKMPDRQPHPDKQVTIMNSRVAQLVARDRQRWPLAGDQLYTDLDLSDENLPPGTRIQAGDAILEVTGVPHTGCKKFVNRYGLDAMKFVNSPEGRLYNLRGINTKVIRGGTIRQGDAVVRLSETPPPKE